MNQPEEWALAHAAGEQPRNEMSVERKRLKAFCLKLNRKLKMAHHYVLLLRFQFEYFLLSLSQVRNLLQLSPSLPPPSWMMVVDLSLNAVRPALLAL